MWVATVTYLSKEEGQRQVHPVDAKTATILDFPVEGSPAHVCVPKICLDQSQGCNNAGKNIWEYKEC